MKQIAQGAEAVIYLAGNTQAERSSAGPSETKRFAWEIKKERIRKNYRLPQIDLKLRKERTKKEASILHKLQRAGVNVPQLLKISEFDLEMEFLDGIKLRDYLDKTSNTNICRLAGIQTAKMHKAGIFHGDLTTSNMILVTRAKSKDFAAPSGKNGSAREDKLFLIDFGLGDYSLRVEDFAVDLHIFKECLTSKHNAIWEKCWDGFVDGYELVDKEFAKSVLKRLKAVELRGRYKHVG